MFTNLNLTFKIKAFNVYFLVFIFTLWNNFITMKQENVDLAPSTKRSNCLAVKN